MVTSSSCASLLRTGNVVDYTAHGPVVEISAQESCEQCAQGRGCGLGLLSRRRSQRVAITVPNKHAKVEQLYPIGSHVTISLPRTSITLLAFCIYALPLIAALLLSGLASLLNGAVWLAPLTFFVTLVSGAISVKYLLRGQSERFRPCLVS
ncbi:SoxR reducing system RseC family protein [Halomonas sp. NPDC076908]|uniref:SoxR reducing system RseC family protein n=1 Tax=Halomonas sp. NPDC076908 TaxID=3390567 RepID=UPI003D07FEBB